MHSAAISTNIVRRLNRNHFFIWAIVAAFRSYQQRGSLVMAANELPLAVGSGILKGIMPDTIPKRRWLRYSLRTLLLVFTLVAIWLAIETHRAREQKLAVEQLQRANAILLFAHQFDASGNADLPLAEPWAPMWLRRAIGDE